MLTWGQPPPAVRRSKAPQLRKHLREQRGRFRLLGLYQGMASSHTA